LLSTDERKSLDRTIGVFEDKKFYIDDRGRKLSHICNKIRKFVIRHKVKVIIIDYLQLMSCDIGTTGNRQEEVATITRTLKELAMELRIPILALSQINRAIHSRSNKRPTLGDLRESGAIEQDADMVVFVHRPAYFRIEETLPEVEYTELIFAKGRSTGIGTVEVAFQSSKAKFINNSYEEMKSLKVQQMGDIPKLSDDTPF
jgi:replicative DNA helicase